MGKPIDEQTVQQMIAESEARITEQLKKMYGYPSEEPWNHELRNIYYSRRETVKDELFGISVLEEVNSRDYKIQCARGSKGAFLWMDDNPGNANLTAEVTEDGGYSKVHLNNLFMLVNQSKGVYCLADIKQFANNTDAVTYFDSIPFRKRGCIYWNTTKESLDITR